MKRIGILILLVLVLAALVPAMAQGPDTPIPACETADLDILEGALIPLLNNLVGQNFTTMTVDQQNEQASVWWNEIVPQLPHCAAALDVIQTMGRALDESLIAAALTEAGRPELAGGHAEQSRTLVQQLLAWADAVEPVQATSVPAATAAPAACTVRGNNVNLRSGPGTNYPVVGSLSSGTSLPVTGTNQARDWYTVNLNGQQAWAAASVTTTTGNCSVLPTVSAPPVPTPRPAPVQQPAQQQPAQQPVQQAPVQQPAAASWNCNGNLYNCRDFGSCSLVMSYWNTCPGDPSRLDSDNDGRPCESLCGG